MAQGGVALNLSSNAVTVLERRYLKKDDKGRVVETSNELFWRVAEHAAQVDARYDPAADVAATARIARWMSLRLSYVDERWPKPRAAFSLFCATY